MQRFHSENNEFNNSDSIHSEEDICCSNYEEEDEEEVLFTGTIHNNQYQKEDYDKKANPISIQEDKSSQKLIPKSSYSNLCTSTANNFTFAKQTEDGLRTISLNEVKHKEKIPTPISSISKFDPIINKKPIEESSCDVCGDEYSWDDDELVICELCNYLVHQGCYGGEIYNKLPNSKWYCQRCETLIKYNMDYKKLKCYLCPDYNGIMKKVGGKWFHIDCVNWTPEIYFEDELRTKIYLKVLSRERFHSLTCNICKKKEGSCVQCDYQDCQFCFHVRCGKEKGLIGTWEEMEKYQNEHFIPVFCKSHRSITSKMNMTDIKLLYNYNSFSEENEESNWSEKQSLKEDKEEELIMDEDDYEVIDRKMIPTLNKNLRTRIVPTEGVNVDKEKRKNIKFIVTTGGIPASLVNSNVNGMMNSKIIANQVAHTPKNDERIKQRIYLQNNFNNCKKSTKSFFESEKKIKNLKF